MKDSIKLFISVCVIFSSAWSVANLYFSFGKYNSIMVASAISSLLTLSYISYLTLLRAKKQERNAQIERLRNRIRDKINIKNFEFYYEKGKFRVLFSCEAGVVERVVNLYFNQEITGMVVDEELSIVVMEDIKIKQFVEAINNPADVPSDSLIFTTDPESRVFVSLISLLFNIKPTSNHLSKIGEFNIIPSLIKNNQSCEIVMASCINGSNIFSNINSSGISESNLNALFDFRKDENKIRVNGDLLLIFIWFKYSIEHYEYIESSVVNKLKKIAQLVHYGLKSKSKEIPKENKTEFFDLDIGEFEEAYVKGVEMGFFDCIVFIYIEKEEHTERKKLSLRRREIIESERVPRIEAMLNKHLREDTSVHFEADLKNEVPETSERELLRD